MPAGGTAQAALVSTADPLHRERCSDSVTSGGKLHGVKCAAPLSTACGCVCDCHVMYCCSTGRSVPQMLCTSMQINQYVCKNQYWCLSPLPLVGDHVCFCPRCRNTTLQTTGILLSPVKEDMRLVLFLMPRCELSLCRKQSGRFAVNPRLDGTACEGGPSEADNRQPLIVSFVYGNYFIVKLWRGFTNLTMPQIETL